jgi:tetratricopeptide (TPR) repeat protein
LLTRSVEIEPDGDNTWFCLGQSLQELGENEAALAAYRQVAELQPLNKQAKELILQLTVAQLTVAASPAQEPPIAAVHQIPVAETAPSSRSSIISAAIDSDLALQKKVQELRALTQHYHDTFVNPRPRW